MLQKLFSLNLEDKASEKINLPREKTFFFLQTLGHPRDLPACPVPATAVTSWHLA